MITQPRATQRYSQGRDLDKDALVSRIVELATRYGRYGYRRVTALLKSEGWRVNHKRVERIWKRSITSQDVLDQLYMLFLVRGVPEHIRSDNGPEFTSKAVREWLSNLGVMALFIEPGSPWENGYVESFNGKLRDEFLNGELFNTLAEARILIEWWRKEYNQVRPHSALGYRPPAPQTIIPAMA